MAVARTIFAFIVRAACRFESLYVREGAVHILTARMRDVYMRVSIAAGGRKMSEGLFRMFRLAEHSPRETVQCMSYPDAVVSCGLCSSAEGPSGEGSAACADPSPVRRA